MRLWSCVLLVGRDSSAGDGDDVEFVVLLLLAVQHLLGPQLSFALFAILHQDLMAAKVKK